MPEKTKKKKNPVAYIFPWGQFLWISSTRESSVFESSSCDNLLRFPLSVLKIFPKE